MRPHLCISALVLALVACRGGGERAIEGDSATLASRLPPGHVPIPDSTAGDVLSPLGAALLDSGNVHFRAGRHSEALRFYRRAAADTPSHGAPWFGIYLVARALDDAQLADSAMARVRLLAPAMSDHPAPGRTPPPSPPPVSPHGSPLPSGAEGGD